MPPRKTTSPKPLRRPKKTVELVKPSGYDYERKKNQVRRYQHEAIAAERDIAPLPISDIDWKRRSACKYDLRAFCEHYLKATFYLGWSSDQLKCIAKAERVFLETYKFALAMPRGGGKTAICRAAILWGTAYGHKLCPTFIGAKQNNAQSTLKAIKTQWYRNPLLLEDFPEVAYPIRRIENRFHMAKGQLFNGDPTSIEWGSESIRYPSLVLPDEVAKEYKRHDKESIRRVDSFGIWISPSAGITISTIGIDGSFRGENQVHPVTLEEIRPDIILLDDIQNDKKAKSPVSVENLKLLVDGAVEGLAGPDKGISVLMPCTVIMEGDVADTYVDPAKRPDYNGERCKLVESWPTGISDNEITMDTDEAKAWNEYINLRTRSMRLYGDIRLATEFYRLNQPLMDKGFHVTWADRVVRSKTADDHNGTISAQQTAMELRLKSPTTFASEYQNIGRSIEVGSVTIISAESLRNKQIGLPRGHIPVTSTAVAAHIDVQDELLYWAVAAADYEFTGVIADYGTWPKTHALLFTREQANSWNLISSGFFREHPEYLKDAQTNRRGRLKAPEEAKMYWAINQLLDELLAVRLTKHEENPVSVPIDIIGIDGRFHTDTIKQIVRERRDPRIHVCFGNQVPITNKQYDEYERTPGWVFEDQRNPTVERVKWIYRIGKDFFPYFSMDADLLKDFLFARLGTATGSPGSISMFKADPNVHLNFSQHVCDTEYPEEISAKGINKNSWIIREGRPSNEYLDISYNLMALLSYLGCCVKTAKDKGAKADTRSLRQIWEAKRGRR